MAIVYDTLMALEVPPAEQSYSPKDCILYALGLGLGHDPMNEDELAFVYEKNLKVLPTMGTVLGHPGFWARERDTGIDWVKIVNGEQGITLHRSDGWTPEKLAAQLKGAFAASFTPLDRSGDVFSWDPV